MSNPFLPFIERREEAARAGYAEEVQIKHEQIELVRNHWTHIQYYRSLVNPTFVIQVLRASVHIVGMLVAGWCLFWTAIALYIAGWENASSTLSSAGWMVGGSVMFIVMKYEKQCRQFVYTLEGRFLRWRYLGMVHTPHEKT